MLDLYPENILSHYACKSLIYRSGRILVDTFIAAFAAHFLGGRNLSFFFIFNENELIFTLCDQKKT